MSAENCPLKLIRESHNFEREKHHYLELDMPLDPNDPNGLKVSNKFATKFQFNDTWNVTMQKKSLIWKNISPPISYFFVLFVSSDFSKYHCDEKSSRVQSTLDMIRQTCSHLGTTFMIFPYSLFSFQEVLLVCSSSMSIMERQTFQTLKRISCIGQEACTEDAARRKGETARNCFELVRISQITIIKEHNY